VSTGDGWGEHRVARLDRLPDGTGVEVDAGGRRLALFRRGADVYALDAACPHAGGPIAEGIVRDGTVTCPWHWWRFRLDTGERVGAPGIRTGCYPVAVRDGEVFVRVPPPAPPRPLRERLLAAAREWQARQEALGTKGAP
jgi:nitrite reductase/ring-hydroxylating ferredoxin subunit